MSRLWRCVLVMCLVAMTMPVPVTVAAVESPVPPPFDQCVPPMLLIAGQQASGALYFACVPPDWNGDLVIFAHGYVAPNEPPTKFLEQLLLPDGNTIPALVLSLKYAFATTSYSKNGLAVTEGLADVRDLATLFKGQFPATQHIYLIGASEGGLVTTLAIEKAASEFSGGLAMCGPIGNFRSQINYWGDFRTLFDYFYKNQLTVALAGVPGVPTPPMGTTVSIPDFTLLNWDALYVPTIAALTTAPTNAHVTEQLLRTSRAPIDLADPRSVVSTTVGILSYNVFATNEGQVELNGQPFDNRYRVYVGSDNDWLLNRTIARFTPSPYALMNIDRYYQTSGRLTKPLITLHNTGDPIVPYWHETLYNAKVLFNRSLLKHINIPIVRYGHCNFTATEAVGAFALLVYKVTGQLPVGLQQTVPDPVQQQELRQLMQLPIEPPNAQ